MLIYDLQAVAAELGVKGDELLEILGMFVDELPQKIAEIDSAANSPEWPELTAAFHYIKGTAANLRLDSLAEIARSSEAAAKQQDIAAVRQLLPALHSAIQAFTDYLLTQS